MAKPLAGRRIVNTRASHQAADLEQLLRAEDAHVIDYPCIDITLPAAADLGQAIQQAAQGHFDWLVLTSRNTVYALARRLHELNLAPDTLAAINTAAVGPATATLAEQLLGVTVTVTPDEHVAEALADMLGSLAGGRIFLPQSNLARPVLVEELSAAGLTVTAVTAYKTVLGSGGDDVPALLAQQQIDAILFTSSSTVTNFIQRLTDTGTRLDLLAGVCIACIGPIAAQTAQEQGLTVQVVPDVYTLAGLVQALSDYFYEVMKPNA